MKGRNMGTDLKPINAKFEFPLDKCSRMRWRGSDGEWQLGWRIYTDEGDGARDLFVALNEHNRTIVLLVEGEYEYDLPKDSNGNAR